MRHALRWVGGDRECVLESLCPGKPESLRAEIMVRRALRARRLPIRRLGKSDATVEASWTTGTRWLVGQFSTAKPESA
jgi:hypothetical protein